MFVMCRKPIFIVVGAVEILWWWWWIGGSNICRM